MKMGAFHTIELELNRKFELRKPMWDSIHLDRIEQATDPGRSADLAAVIMQEGLAQVRTGADPRARAPSCSGVPRHLLHDDNAS